MDSASNSRSDSYYDSDSIQGPILVRILIPNQILIQNRIPILTQMLDGLDSVSNSNSDSDSDWDADSGSDSDPDFGFPSDVH